MNSFLDEILCLQDIQMSEDETPNEHSLMVNIPSFNLPSFPERGLIY